jgi:hypothetical protein
VAERKKEVGPRGGTSTVYGSGLLRKTAYFQAEEWAAIRKAAYERELSYADIIRESVRAHLKLDD